MATPFALTDAFAPVAPVALGFLIAKRVGRLLSLKSPLNASCSLPVCNRTAGRQVVLNGFASQKRMLLDKTPLHYVAFVVAVTLPSFEKPLVRARGDNR